MSSRTLCFSFVLLASCFCTANNAPAIEAVIPTKTKEPLTDAEEFGRGVRTLEPRSAQSELESFHVADGLTVELVASEPQIAKPLNMAFDWKGRLWVTQTYEYPYQYDPAKDPEAKGPRDSIVILEDTNGDGYREKSTIFADKLNIPMGLLPYRDGVICFNIPNIMFLRDADGDSKCDTREVLIGPFDTTRDTHGMINSLRWGADGWIMANHGFNNQSVVSGKDGKKVSLTSGNVFRFRPDGSAVELYAQGQVNPFGMTIDEFGGVFSADCHSKPISQVIQGGCYESFGRPHDGLGFIPDIMTHLHGSTAIAGLEIGRGSNFPDEFQTQFVSGNVMTSRINRNQIKRQGLTVTAVEQADLLTTEDSWFRPVDLRLGPDGWIYVADFYNRIIGHYEVPLTHEGRDRFRGRVWRIGRTGAGSSSFAPLNDLQQCTVALNDPNPTVVRLALQRIEELASSAEKLNSTSKSAGTSTSAIVANAWADQWLEADGRKAKWLSLATNSDDVISANALQILAVQLEKDGLETSNQALQVVARQAASDWQKRPHAALHGSRILAKLGSASDATDMLSTIVAAQKADPMLRAALRISLRELLKNEKVRTETVRGWKTAGGCATDEPLTEDGKQPRVAIDSPEGKELFYVLIALPPEMFPTEAALAYLGQSEDKSSLPVDVLASIATAFPAKDSGKLLCFLETIYGDQPQEHLRQLTIVSRMLRDQGKLSKEAKDGITEFVKKWQTGITDREKVASNSNDELVTWFAYEGSGQNKKQLWGVEQRDRLSTDGSQSKIPVFSSFPLGEQYTGKFLSSPLRADGDLVFYVCGHNGTPDQPDSKNNRIQLVDTNSQEVLLEAFPPRSDTAMRVSWDLRPFKARSIAVRIIDNDSGTAYAWIAVGGFEPSGLGPNALRQEFSHVLELLEMIGGISGREQANVRGFRLPNSDDYIQLQWKLAAYRPLDLDSALAAWLFEHHNFGLASIIAGGKTADAAEAAKPVLQRVAQQCDTSSQRELVELLSSQPQWHEALLTSVKQGWLSPLALSVLPKVWWQANSDKPVVAELERLKPSESEDTQRKMQKFVELRDKIQQTTADVAAGKAVFAQQCAVCHQFAGQGKVVGPQLEGVGGRGLPRLCEDVLLPNQNVDHAFHAAAILTLDGEVITGLVRQRNSESIVIADAKGQERTISVKEIETEKTSGLSLMPDNFSDVLSVQQLADLIEYLRKPNQAP